MRTLTQKPLFGGASEIASRRGQPRPATGRPRVAGIALVVMLLGIVAGCVTAGAGPVSQNFWREDLGRLNTATIDDALAKVVQKHALRLEQRYDQGGEVRWELSWIPREVVAEEQLRGVVNARNRIVIRGVELGAGNVDNYRMTWELANEVTTQTDTNWHPDIVPASIIDKFRPIYSDLRLEVRTGVRR